MSGGEGELRQETGEATEKVASPLSVIYPGEFVRVAGREVFVKPFGVKALMTEVPGLLGSLMGKLTPVYEAAKTGAGSEVILRALMESAGDDLVDFVARVVRLTPAELEAMTAAEFVSLLRAMVRQNADFFDQVGGLYSELGRPIANVLGGTGSQSSSS